MDTDGESLTRIGRAPGLRAGYPRGYRHWDALRLRRIQQAIKLAQQFPQPVTEVIQYTPLCFRHNGFLSHLSLLQAPGNEKSPYHTGKRGLFGQLSGPKGT